MGLLQENNIEHSVHFVLSKHVLSWAEIDNISAGICLTINSIDTSLTELNDNGTNFCDIADIIEEYM
jgi:hypothetical protein